jgi:hypothetical protein
MVTRRQENSWKIVPSVSVSEGKSEYETQFKCVKRYGGFAGPVRIGEYDSEAHSTFGVAPSMHVALEVGGSVTVAM